MRAPFFFASVWLAGCATVGETGSQTRTFEGPYDQLVVETVDGRVELVVGGTDVVEVEFLPNAGDSWTDTDDAGTLTLTAVCLGDTVAGCGGGFVITLPPALAVTADTDTGQVAIGAGYAGVLDLGTASGPIDGDGLGAASLTVLDGTGPIDLSFAELPTAISIDTGSAPTALAVPAASYALDLDSTGVVSHEGVTDDPMGIPLRVHSGTGNIGVVGI